MYTFFKGGFSLPIKCEIFFCAVEEVSSWVELEALCRNWYAQ